MVTGITEGTIARTKELLDLETKDLAKAIGCTSGTLNRWRRGAQDPSKRFLQKLQLLDAFMYELQKRSRSRRQAREWFETRIPALGNHTPRDVFMEGRFDLLVVYLRRHERI
ncbi:MAG: helix-turn-helix transcriptional regulator [Gemmatimonadota bacterium]|nr:helix-turn-helix transcriptional regulator [Gemmatimonadota bacterium]